MNNEFALLSESKTEKERGLNYGRKIVYLRWHEPAITLILGNPFPSSLESLEQELHWKPASIFSVLLLVIRPAVFFFHSFNNFCSPQLSHLNNSQIPQVLCTILETREWRRTDDILLGKLQAKKKKKKVTEQLSMFLSATLFLNRGDWCSTRFPRCMHLYPSVRRTCCCHMWQTSSGHKMSMPRKERCSVDLTFPVTSAQHRAPVLCQPYNAICLFIFYTLHLLARVWPMHGVLAWNSGRPGVSWPVLWSSGCHFISPMPPAIFLKPARAKTNSFAFPQTFLLLVLNLCIKLKCIL